MERKTKLAAIATLRKAGVPEGDIEVWCKEVDAQPGVDTGDFAVLACSHLIFRLKWSATRDGGKYWSKVYLYGLDMTTYTTRYPNPSEAWLTEFGPIPTQTDLRLRASKALSEAGLDEQDIGDYLRETWGKLTDGQWDELTERQRSLESSGLLSATLHVGKTLLDAGLSEGGICRVAPLDDSQEHTSSDGVHLAKMYRGRRVLMVDGKVIDYPADLVDALAANKVVTVKAASKLYFYTSREHLHLLKSASVEVEGGTVIAKIQTHSNDAALDIKSDVGNAIHYYVLKR